MDVEIPGKAHPPVLHLPDIVPHKRLLQWLHILVQFSPYRPKLQPGRDIKYR